SKRSRTLSDSRALRSEQLQIPPHVPASPPTTPEGHADHGFQYPDHGFQYRCRSRRRRGSTHGQQGRTRASEPTRTEVALTKGFNQKARDAPRDEEPLLIPRSRELSADHPWLAGVRKRPQGQHALLTRETPALLAHAT